MMRALPIERILSDEKEGSKNAYKNVSLDI